MTKIKENCPHLRTVYCPLIVPGGSIQERWICESCEREFFPHSGSFREELKRREIIDPGKFDRMRQDFIWPKRERELFQAGIEYEKDCESFDRAACEYKNERGIAIPLTPDERGTCNRHALKVKAMIEQKYYMRPGEFQKAMDLFHNAYPNGMTPDVLKKIQEEEE